MNNNKSYWSSFYDNLYKYYVDPNGARKPSIRPDSLLYGDHRRPSITEFFDAASRKQSLMHSGGYALGKLRKLIDGCCKSRDEMLLSNR